MSAPLIEAVGVGKRFAAQAGAFARADGEVHALRDVSLGVEAGATLGIVGESGCGKSTLARCLVGLEEPSEGEVRFEGRSLAGLDRAGRREFHRTVQMVFQDPYASLNPRRRIGASVEAPLRVRGGLRAAERRHRVLAALERVGLTAERLSQYPAELSGGQLQRVGIARALVLEPRVIVADEPVSALDVSVQAQILGLLAELQRELGIAIVFIGHDLGVIRQVADEVAVMYLGRVVEEAGAERLFRSPRHPYTGVLLSSAPIPDPDLNSARERIASIGDLPSPLSPPAGCSFHPRCPSCVEICRELRPPLEEKGGGTRAACHCPLDPDTEVLPAMEIG